MTFARSIFWGLMICCLTLPALAACPAGSLRVSQTGGGGYDPSRRIGEVLSLRVAAAPSFDNLACLTETPILVKLGPAGESSLSAGGRQLNVELENNTALRAAPGASVLSVTAINTLLGGSPVVLDFATVEPGQLVPVDRYEETVVIIADGVTLGEAIVGFSVAPSVQITGATAAGSETIDFDEPTVGESISTSFFYRSNANVLVRGYSENGGKMVHERGEAYGVIPYRVSVAGHDLDSFRLGAVDLPTASAGSTVPAMVKFTITGTSSLFAGDYSDIFTVELLPY